MTFIELFILATGLSMDAFAVAICKGLSIKKISLNSCLIVGLWFGIFQALMPIIGYFLGLTFSKYIVSFDHWVAFILLAIIGGKMIYDSFKKENENIDGSLSFKSMFTFAVATSIDALAVGVSFAFLKVDIWVSAIIIGIVTFLFGAVGVKIGSIFGTKYKNKAELLGGIALCLIGIKILLEHLGVINF